MHGSLAACAVTHRQPYYDITMAYRGISVFLCWEIWGLKDYTSDWNVKQLLQLPITSVRTLPETMQLVSKAERQTHPREARLDNKASLEGKDRETEIFFLISLHTVIWLTESHPQPNRSLNPSLIGKWKRFRWNVGLNKFFFVCGIIHLSIKVHRGPCFVNKPLHFDRHPSLKKKKNPL